MHGTLDRAVASLRAAAETGRKAFDLDPVQFNLFDLLERVAKEGQQLTDAAGRAPAGGAAPPGRPTGIAEAVTALLAPVNTTRLFWPRGASPNRERNALEVAESQAWPLPPLVPGVWLDLRPMELAAEKTRLARDPKLSALARDVRRIRLLPLPFYQDGSLYEAEVRRAGADGIVDYVRAGGDELVIDGMSNPIHDFNKSHPLVLASATDAAAYLRFFVASIQGAEGTFRLLDGPGDLFAGSSALGAADRLGRLVVPLRVREESDGGWGATGTVRYGNNFFYAIFRLPTNGVVEMRNDTPVVASQPLAVERYTGGLRVISDYYIRKAALESTASAAAAAGRWNDASQAEQSVVSLMRNKGFGDAEADKRALVGELISLSWYQLHAKRFEDALASSTEAHALDAANLVVETNRAHALLLTGHADDALALYRAHAGDTVGTQPWNQAVLNDLDSLEKAGVTSPAFARVRQLVGGSR
jgi:hypothetical protein